MDSNLGFEEISGENDFGALFEAEYLKKGADFLDNVFNKDKGAVLLVIESQTKRRPFCI